MCVAVLILYNVYMFLNFASATVRNKNYYTDILVR